MTTDIDALVERLGVTWERLPNADCAAKKINAILRQRKEAAQALTRLSDENARLREAGSALVSAMDACKPDIDGAFQMAAMHGCQYDGRPTYGEQLEALRAALQGDA